LFPFFIFVIFIYTNIYVMTSKEFILWLKGFTEGVHEFNITPKQWDTLKEQLAHVDDNTIPMGGVIVDHNTFKTVYPNWSGTNPNGTITTTPGYGGITFSGSYNPSTSTTYGYPSGSVWSYTTYQPTNIKTEKQNKFKKRKAKSVKEWEDNFDLGGEE